MSPITIPVHVGHLSALAMPGISRSFTAQRLLLVVWVFMGAMPLLLQVRSYVKFVIPHRMAKHLVVPPDAQKETASITELCPVKGHFLARAWWNLETTHYYSVDAGRICHFVVPQYNSHGNYFIGNSRVGATSFNCPDGSFPYEEYLYHGSIGYYSFFIQMKGTYCPADDSPHPVVYGLGTFDINGSLLAEDAGSNKLRMSYWYSIVGAIWLVYRALILRRSYIICKRYGQKCEQMGEGLRRNEAVVFVQESMRLTAHRTTNYHRVILLYLLIEGIMSDFFLIVANDGVAIKIQYASLGYNLSGLLLMIFEFIEEWLPEKWRIFTKRLLFSYESSLVGELVTAAALQYFLSGLNRSDLQRSRPAALAVSYYVWSLVGHGILVLVITTTIITVRAFWSMSYVWWLHRSLAIFSEACCVDTVCGVRNKMAMLGGYCLEDGNLYYKREALKAFGLLRMEDDNGAEYLVLHKLHWLTVSRNDLFVIGNIRGQRVEPCSEYPCIGVTTFFGQILGGTYARSGSLRSLFVRKNNQVSPTRAAIKVLPMAPPNVPQQSIPLIS